jgi:hypothetical protein
MGVVHSTLVSGGPDNPYIKALAAEIRRLADARLEWQGPALRYVFTAEGAVMAPSWQGVKVHRFNRVDGMLELDVAVSWHDLTSNDAYTLIHDAMVQSADLVGAYLARRKISHRIDSLRDALAAFRSLA